MHFNGVAYPSPRNTPEGYKKVILERGWNELGETRVSSEYVKVKGENMEYEVSKDLVDADGVLVITHIKGHPCTGFGGAIKNLGMGALSKKTKSAIHSGGEPVFKREKCSACRSCEKACPISGIDFTDSPKFRECLGCSNCAYACPNGAIKPRINYFDVLLAEGASCANRNFRRKHYISIMKRITKLCDCERNPGGIIAKDYGYLSSGDAVSIDLAAHDIIAKNEGEVFLRYNKKTGLAQIEAAERFGMGSRKYDMKILKANK
ncbi:MAG: DUF362 domain-containing protein [Candidatus Woesearchaeota archaeon]|nr:DUF362 domain-containing protein [Candidatus Woesearchaeota archaeon]